MEDWRKYQMNWQPGMPVIGYSNESQQNACLLATMRWTEQNQLVYKRDEAAMSCHLKLLKSEQKEETVQSHEKKNDELHSIHSNNRLSTLKILLGFQQ